MSTVSKSDSADTIWKFVHKVPLNYYRTSGKFLFLPVISTDEERQAVVSKIKVAAFKGNFQLRTDFGKHFPGEVIPFRFVDKATSVGEMKRQISDLTGVPFPKIQISFQNLRPLSDDTTFSDDLNCHGKGGENFWLWSNR